MKAATPFNLRRAGVGDIPQIFVVRTSVRENLLTTEQLYDRGITPEAVARSFDEDCRGWVAEISDQIVAFSIADKAEASLFALFVSPPYQGQGIGSRLLSEAVNWLASLGLKEIWLSTAESSRAMTFYLAHGWRNAGKDKEGSIRMTLSLPAR